MTGVTKRKVDNMPNPPQDPGYVRWFMFIPDLGKFAIPAGVTDREGYARNSGATRLLAGDEVRWSRDSPSGRHLAVVR